MCLLYHLQVRTGCTAAFAIKQEGDDTESCVYVAELRPEAKKADYEGIAETILAAVSKEQGLYLSAVILVKTRTVPKTTSGKIGRAHCRTLFEKKQLQVLYQWDDLEAEAEVSAPVKAAVKLSVSEIRSKIMSMVQEQLGEEVESDATLLDTGLSSAATTEISLKMSREFGVKVRPTVMFTSPTIDAIR
jgi:acyl carrier protein